ncbi:putative RNA helicase [Helianthus debilis subsp. tardiflorus]
MANLGDGAEARARFKQYEYRANSSLVLTTDSRPRDTHEPTGEPESLFGKIDPKNFGDRASRLELSSSNWVSDLDIVQEDVEEEDDVLDRDGNNAMQMGGGMDDEDSQEANEGMTLNLQNIDAYWLQRKISQAYEQQIDPQQSQKLAEEVLKFSICFVLFY